MYTAFFKFTENPFNLTPDPRYLFLSRYHQEALDHLMYGINMRKGFILITGGIGTGKTTICRVLLDYLEANTKSALIFNSFISDLELLETINQEFGIDRPSNTGSKKEHIDALNQFLLQNYSEGGNAVILIDEAQNLSNKVLEQLRMLSNLETRKDKLVQIVLVGQPELHEILAAPSIRQLNERITVRYRLKPLAFKDIREYVEHRMIVAGARGNLQFTTNAFRQIYAYSQGNPRRINSICDRALLIAYAQEKFIVSKSIMKKAAAELKGDLKTVRQANPWSWKKFASYTVLLLLLIIVAAIGGWSYRDGVTKITLKGENPAGRGKPSRFVAPMPAEAKAPLFLDEKDSLSLLFTTYYDHRRQKDKGVTALQIVRFDLDPEYYVRLKKPFRVASSQPGSAPKYLVIRETRPDEAVAVDSNGEDRILSREFIFSNWGRAVSWVYLPDEGNLLLRKGMSTPAVLEWQQVLQKAGYMVEPTGIYDQKTFQETLKFQKDFGLSADGIAGPLTRALLYQMVKKDESYS